MFEKSIAQKNKVKLMLGLCGPSGAGKTLSALRLAYGITGDWKKITLADTENGSSLYYAGKKTGEWGHIPFDPTMKFGYSPTNWVKLIEHVENDNETQVLILDSITHEWNGAGGCLELVDKIAVASYSGNKFAAWGKVTPQHSAFIDKMRNSRLHIIATIRSKTAHELEKDSRGKSVPVKVGLAPIQREGLDYEFSVLFDINNIEHLASVSKDRTGLFQESPPFLITEEIGKMLTAWANEGGSNE